MSKKLLPNVFNEYYRVISPNGKEITYKIDNGLFDKGNPWKYIADSWRYRTGNKDGREIEIFRKTGWEPIGESDVDYWENYINQLESKVKDKEPQNWLQYTFNRMEPIKQKGGKINYIDLF